jgi:hypothetical protein
MFKQTNQVQTIDVNEWVAKLMAAHDDVKTVERIRKKLDDYCTDYIAEKAANLNSRTSLYDWYYEAMPHMDGFMEYVAELIDYQMPENLAEMWRAVINQYCTIKAEEGKDA